MAIIDRVKFDGPANVLVWRFPGEDLSWGTQVIVNETQEALFLKGGKILDLLGPGTHTLKTANIPLLRSLVEATFGGATPFSAEIYFINKATHLDVKWGTQTPILLLDPTFRVPLPVRAFGQFGIKIVDSRAVFTQLSATSGEFTIDGLSELFRGALMTRCKDYISETIIKQKINVLEINACLESIAEALQKKLSADFAPFGVSVVNFFLNSIDVPEEDETVRRLKKALADRAEIDILGDGYKTKRTFDTLETAAGNEGGGAGAGMGIGMGLGAGVGVGGLVSGMVGAMSGVSAKTAPAALCPSCKAPVAAGAKFCAECGKAIGAAICADCKAEIPTGAKFCPGCGKRTS